MAYSGPQRPKLRASCDMCGAAKLKCDRRHPSCTRCQSLGVTCVYGISRKSNRKRMWQGQGDDPDVASEHRQQQPQNQDDAIAGFLNDAFVIGEARHPLDSHAHMLDDISMDGGIDTLATIPAAYTDMGMPQLDDFSYASLDDWTFTNLMTQEHDVSQYPTLSPPFVSPGPATPPSSVMTTMASTPISRTSCDPDKSHDCFREASAILDTLTFSSTSRESSQQSEHDHIPIDQVLRINREACRNLARLLACRCAKIPHLALLYASIFVRMLFWYQQTAGHPLCGAPSSSSLPSNVADGDDSRNAPPWTWPTSRTGSECSSAPSLMSESNTASSSATRRIVVSAQMAMGSFEIDDESVQATLKTQLVLSELKRAEQVLELFPSLDGSSVSSSFSSSEMYSVGVVEGLHGNLGTWLRREHSHTANVVRHRIASLAEACAME